jgi:hypothetical protein
MHISLLCENVPPEDELEDKQTVNIMNNLSFSTWREGYRLTTADYILTVLCEPFFIHFQEERGTLPIGSYFFPRILFNGYHEVFLVEYVNDSAVLVSGYYKHTARFLPILRCVTVIPAVVFEQYPEATPWYDGPPEEPDRLHD